MKVEENHESWKKGGVFVMLEEIREKENEGEHLGKDLDGRKSKVLLVHSWHGSGYT